MLQVTQPLMCEEFINGNFSINRIPGAFNRILPDQSIKETINQEQKGPGN